MSQHDPKKPSHVPPPGASKHGTGKAHPAPPSADGLEHEGGTDAQVGDLTGPGAGYDDEAEQVKDRGGVS